MIWPKASTNFCEDVIHVSTIDHPFPLPLWDMLHPFPLHMVQRGSVLVRSLHARVQCTMWTGHWNFPREDLRDCNQTGHLSEDTGSGTHKNSTVLWPLSNFSDMGHDFMCLWFLYESWWVGYNFNYASGRNLEPLSSQICQSLTYLSDVNAFAQIKINVM